MICTRCHGAGWTFRVNRTPKHKACPRCHTTGVTPASHADVLAVRVQRLAA